MSERHAPSPASGSASLSEPIAALPPETTVGPVTIRVADLDRSVRFYQEVLGFRPAAGANGLTALGAGGPPVLLLKQVPGARPARRFSGLFHFAILVPSRPALGHALRRLAEADLGIGQADHLVSEALYLADPDEIEPPTGVIPAIGHYPVRILKGMLQVDLPEMAE